MKDLEIKISVLYNLVFANNTILSFFFFFFLNIGLYFLIPGVIVQILNFIAEVIVPIGIPSKEAIEEIEIHSVTAETKIRTR